MHTTEFDTRVKTSTDVTGLADLLPDAVFLVDDHGRVNYASAACTSIFGFTPQEIVGNFMLDLVMPDDRDRTIKEAAEVISRGQRVGFENRYLRKDGSEAHVMWSARWLRSERLRVGVGRDVTHLRQQQHRLHRGLTHATSPLAPYELRVLDLLLTGASEKQIADRLGLAVTTTHSYVTGIFRKFGVRGRAGLMSLWIQP